MLQEIKYVIKGPGKNMLCMIQNYSTNDSIVQNV